MNPWEHRTSSIQHPPPNRNAISLKMILPLPFGRGEDRGENSPKNSRIEPMNRRKTSNTQHPTSNDQWFPIGPLIGGWVLDVGCSMFPRVHGREFPEKFAH